MTKPDTSREAVERPEYLIRKRGLYYRPNSEGYTTSAIMAGRYTLADAIKITHPNGPDGPRDEMTFIHEGGIADEDWHAYRALLDRAVVAEAVLVEARESMQTVAMIGYDQGWNDAIEGAARAQEAAFRKGVFGEKHPDHIRALKKGSDQ